MSAASALRRFDAMLARAVHKGTPIEEARTALEGARRVAANNDINRAEERIRNAEIALGFRGVSDAMGSFGHAVEEAAERARGVFRIVRRPDGTYGREYR